MSEASTDDAEGRLLRAVEAFQAGGDRDGAFRQLFDAYYRPLERFFARKGFDRETCLDLTQETLVGIYRGLEAYRPEARFSTWVYKIATTNYLKAIRSRTAVKRSGDEVSTDEVVPGALGVDGGQLDGMLDDERRQALRRAVAGLPEKMRRCLVLRVYQERSYHEVAVVLGLSIETVKAHLYQARKRLGELLGSAGGVRGGQT